MNVLLIAVILIFVIFLIIGFQRGLFKAIVGMTATILTLLIVFLFAPVVFQYVTDMTDVDERLEAIIYDRLKASIEDEVRQKLLEVGDYSTRDELRRAAQEETERILESDPDRSTEMELISVQNVPGFIKKRLLTDNNSDVYERLGVNNVYHYIARSVALSVVNLIVTLAFFVIVRLLFLISALLLDKSLDKIPVLGGLNHLGGMLLGTVTALIVIWMVMVVYSLIDVETYEIMIGQSVILAKLDEFNLIARLFYKMGI